MPPGIATDSSGSCLLDRGAGNNPHLIWYHLNFHCIPDDRLTMKIAMASRLDLDAHFTFTNFGLARAGQGVWKPAPYTKFEALSLPSLCIKRFCSGCRKQKGRYEKSSVSSRLSLKSIDFGFSLSCSVLVLALRQLYTFPVFLADMQASVFIGCLL